MAVRNPANQDDRYEVSASQWKPRSWPLLKLIRYLSLSWLVVLGALLGILFLNSVMLVMVGAVCAYFAAMSTKALWLLLQQLYEVIEPFLSLKLNMCVAIATGFLMADGLRWIASMHTANPLGILILNRINDLLNLHLIMNVGILTASIYAVEALLKPIAHAAVVLLVKMGFLLTVSDKQKNVRTIYDMANAAELLAVNWDREVKMIPPYLTDKPTVERQAIVRSMKRRKNFFLDNPPELPSSEATNTSVLAPTATP